VRLSREGTDCCGANKLDDIVRSMASLGPKKAVERKIAPWLGCFGAPACRVFPDHLITPRDSTRAPRALLLLLPPESCECKPRGEVRLAQAPGLWDIFVSTGYGDAHPQKLREEPLLVDYDTWSGFSSATRKLNQLVAAHILVHSGCSVSPTRLPAPVEYTLSHQQPSTHLHPTPLPPFRERVPPRPDGDTGTSRLGRIWDYDEAVAYIPRPSNGMAREDWVPDTTKYVCAYLQDAAMCLFAGPMLHGALPFLGGPEVTKPIGLNRQGAKFERTEVP